MSAILGVEEVASEPATNKSRRCGAVQARLARLRYAVTGPNPLLIALHGGPGIGCRYLEPEVMEAMAGVAEVALYDQRGSGLSTGVESPELLNMNQFVADLEAVRIALGCERPILIGHSFGGLLALHYAAAYPGRVAGLVLLDPDPASHSLWSGYIPRVRARQSQRCIEEIAAIQSNSAWVCDRALFRTLSGAIFREWSRTTWVREPLYRSYPSKPDHNSRRPKVQSRRLGRSSIAGNDSMSLLDRGGRGQLFSARVDGLPESDARQQHRGHDKGSLTFPPSRIAGRIPRGFAGILGSVDQQSLRT